MQQDYATEQQQAAQGCGQNNVNQNQISADANQVDADATARKTSGIRPKAWQASTTSRRQRCKNRPTRFPRA